MPERFTTQKSIGRKGMGVSTGGTAYDVSVVDREGHNVGYWLST